MKFNFAYYIKLELEVNGHQQVIDHYFKPHAPLLVLEPSFAGILAQLDDEVTWMQELIANWVHQGSGWRVVGIKRVYLGSVRYLQLRGGTYEPLP